MRRLSSFNLQGWVKEHRHLLKPPVGNKLIFSGEFKVMLVAGPNTRSDYHVEEGEEWFFQLEGDIVLKIVDNDQFYDVHIREGETFCLPPRIPHSPQRPENTLGIVIERERRSGELDTLQWYCQNDSCRKVLHSKQFFCTDLGKDLVPIINEYYSDESHRTCKSCGFVEHPPSPAT